jgi:hypothetical protein
MSDQCALDESGGLKEAEDIEFFYSESEKMPLTSSTVTLKQKNTGSAGELYTPLPLLFYVISLSGLRRGQRKKNTEKLYTSIAAEQLNEFGSVIKKHRLHQQGPRSSRPVKKPKMDTTCIDDESDDSCIHA